MSGKRIDLIIKLFGILLTVSTLIIGLIQYKINSNREFRAKYYSEQVKVYEKLLTIASHISNFNIDSLNTRKFEQLEFDYNVLYFGPVNLYQDAMVEEYCAKFYLAISSFKNSNPDYTQEYMRALSFKLSGACRKSLQKTYGVNISELYLELEP
jgi:hypothetical protein